jgi:xylan 1,4-beta-xylosidase
MFRPDKKNVWAILCLTISFFAVSITHAANFTVSVDAADDKGVLRHFWEEAIGTGEAYQLDLPGHREHLRMAREELGMKRTIHHGLTHDNMQIYNEDNAGVVTYNFAKFDTVYDYVIKTLGMRPHFSFFPMPAKLAANPGSTCMEPKFIHSKPKSWEKWGALCRAIAKHVVERYDTTIARECYYRVWNENNVPNCFDMGTEDDYFHLYDYAAEGVKSVDSLLRVGGPSYAGADPPLITSFLNHCLTANYAAPQKKSTPVDFVSGTFYSSGTNEKSLGGIKGISQKTGEIHNMLSGKKLEDRIEFHFTEYGSSYSRRFTKGDIYGKHDTIKCGS